ncbi:hypothetical protein BGX23_008802 [Mortierella sp. AD031]|nr:hypothetical protein BGX23_008802 [Mortierella sp. AD031]
MAPIFVSPWLLQNMSAVPSFFMTEVNDQLNYDQAVAYLSVRILIIGGVILFFLGLCCIAAVLLRFNRQQHLEVQRIEFIKGCILDQDAIQRSLPVRIWPSQQQFLMDKENRVVAIIQQVTKINNNSHGIVSKASSSNSVRNDSDSSQSQARNGFSRSARKGLGFVEKFSHRGCSASSPSTLSSSSGSPSQDPHASLEVSFSGIPLSTMATDSMPVSPIPIPTQNSLGRENYAESTYEEACCSICLCEYITDDRVRVLPCTHEYHAECIDIWLANKSTQCPLCKHDLLDDLEFSSRLHSS